MEPWVYKTLGGFRSGIKSRRSSAAHFKELLESQLCIFCLSLIPTLNYFQQENTFVK